MRNEAGTETTQVEKPNESGTLPSETLPNETHTETTQDTYVLVNAASSASAASSSAAQTTQDVCWDEWGEVLDSLAECGDLNELD